MPKICYVNKTFTSAHLGVIEKANEIIDDYAERGFSLTLRQLYYQFVSRDWIANKQTEYRRLGSIINDARLAGLVDWYAIEDRTRNLKVLQHWVNPGHVIKEGARYYHKDMWENQEYRIEVWIEKDALLGVIQGVCQEHDVPYFSCRGYTSQSELWRAAQRAQEAFNDGKVPIIIHLGDHDPSGIDMTRDIFDRFELFCGGVRVERIALNMDQIEQYNPPPNPAKLSDARAKKYTAEYGYDSWELDALDPDVMSKLIGEQIDLHKDHDQWETDEEQLEEERKLLTACSEKWYDEVVPILEK